LLEAGFQACDFAFGFVLQQGDHGPACQFVPFVRDGFESVLLLVPVRDEAAAQAVGRLVAELGQFNAHGTNRVCRIVGENGGPPPAAGEAVAMMYQFCGFAVGHCAVFHPRRQQRLADFATLCTRINGAIPADSSLHA